MKNSHSPSVAIQIVTFNNIYTIDTCMKSIVNQSYKNIACFVLDNCSNDGTLRNLNKYKYVFVKLEKNVGYAAAHNILFKKHTCKYILTLNPDVRLDPFFIQKMVLKLETDSSLGSASGLLYRVDMITQRTTVVDSAGLFMRRNRRQGLRFEGKVIEKNNEVQIFGPDGAAAFYRRKMLEDITLNGEIFDEDFFMHKEDVDVAWRSQLRGWKSLFIPNAKAYHVRTFRAGNRTVSSLLRMIAVRNRYFLMIKNELSILFLRDFFWIFLYDIGIILYILVRERSSLSAYAQVFNNLPKMFRKRKKIQSTRRASVAYMSQWFI